MSQTTRIVEDHLKLECPRNLTAEQRRFADIGGWRTFLSFLLELKASLESVAGFQFQFQQLLIFVLCWNI